VTGRGALLGIAGAALLAACANPASAPGWREGEERAARVEAGATLFSTFCAPCHGLEARGDGPAAAALSPRPANLRAIAARRGGHFPAPEIAGFIDGRLRVDAHGTSAMPVWGRRFDDRNLALDEETKLSPGSILEIVEYLESIQDPG
jgi:mono/diheme cytochrome c family protein